MTTFKVLTTLKEAARQNALYSSVTIGVMMTTLTKMILVIQRVMTINNWLGPQEAFSGDLCISH